MKNEAQARNQNPFADALRLIRGEMSEAEIQASAERYRQRLAARPQPSDVFPARLSEDCVKLAPNWARERIEISPSLYPDRCPVCDGVGSYMPRGGSVDHLERCPCQALAMLIARVDSLRIPAALHRATWGGTDWSRFNGVQTRDRVAGFVNRICAHRDPCEPGTPGLILEGPTGSGKSHISALVSIAAAARGVSVRWFRWTDLIDEVGALLKTRGTNFEKIYDLLFRPYELIVIDDLGMSENRAPWVDDMWERMIGRRAESKRTIIATTNYSVERLATMAGARVASRLYGTASTFVLNGEDHRFNRGAF